MWLVVTISLISSIYISEAPAWVRKNIKFESGKMNKKENENIKKLFLFNELVGKDLDVLNEARNKINELLKNIKKIDFSNDEVMCSLQKVHIESMEKEIELLNEIITQKSSFNYLLLYLILDLPSRELECFKLISIENCIKKELPKRMGITLDSVNKTLSRIIDNFLGLTNNSLAARTIFKNVDIYELQKDISPFKLIKLLSEDKTHFSKIYFNRYLNMINRHKANIDTFREGCYYKFNDNSIPEFIKKYQTNK